MQDFDRQSHPQYPRCLAQRQCPKLGSTGQWLWLRLPRPLVYICVEQCGGHWSPWGGILSTLSFCYLRLQALASKLWTMRRNFGAGLSRFPAQATQTYPARETPLKHIGRQRRESPWRFTYLSTIPKLGSTGQWLWLRLPRPLVYICVEQCGGQGYLPSSRFPAREGHSNTLTRITRLPRRRSNGKNGYARNGKVLFHDRITHTRHVCKILIDNPTHSIHAVWLNVSAQSLVQLVNGYGCVCLALLYTFVSNNVEDTGVLGVASCPLSPPAI